MQRHSKGEHSKPLWKARVKVKAWLISPHIGQIAAVLPPDINCVPGAEDVIYNCEINCFGLQGWRQKHKNRISPGKRFNKVTTWAAVLGTGGKLQFEVTSGPAQWRRGGGNNVRAYYPRRKPQGDFLPCLPGWLCCPLQLRGQPNSPTEDSVESSGVPQ